MMSMNAVLMKFFKLPPAVRMMLALAGFGSLASIVFFVLPALRTREARIWIVIVVGAALVLGLLIYLLRRMFRRKKSAALGGALETQGPTRGDVAEQERIYREKFVSKMAELKANGLSVYHLPWFVLMGEPGCGKTASLIHSGLDFPLGKDEVPGFGGTRNYNWWFTNEAVILDTAGRIAFQEEGTTDKVEWEYFLKLLGRHRPRCPINGVIIAVPADKLLRDDADERAQKCAILRERLRQVHQILGVRFPTFVLVTKMDLVGGFSEFFEEIRVDLQQRNQMFGWSRPGEFQSAYDPAGFPEAFDSLYYRVRDWSMRYLQRKATDEEIGLIVTFPEAFRQLRDPLNDYVATIFQKSPLLEPPFFRGFYFTSAVQEGAPIFDVFARSQAGHVVAERPTRAADSKAFFIHDLYAHKVFPEHGLVFRSAKHVTINQRMRRLVWIGSAAMLLIMLTFFGFGYVKVSDLVTAPREDCQAARARIVASEEAPAAWNQEQWGEDLELAKRLRGHSEAYDAPLTALYARMLFIGASSAEPRDHVRLIHARFVLERLLEPVLRAVQQGFRDTDLAQLMPERRRRYLEALGVCVRWYGEMAGQHELTELTEEQGTRRAAEFDQLLAHLEIAEQDRADAVGQFEYALRSLVREPRSFGREILRRTLALDETQYTDALCAAVAHITDSWLPFTDLRADRTDQNVRYWLDFSQKVGELRRRYQTLLGLAARFEARDTYPGARETFLALTLGAERLGSMDVPPEPHTLAEAYYDLVKFLSETRVPQTAEQRIIRFGDLYPLLKQRWDAEFEPLVEALQKGAPDRTAAPQDRVYRAIADGRNKLELSLQTSLATIRETLGLGPDEEPLDHYINARLIDKKEAAPQLPLRPGEDAQVFIAPDATGTGARLKNVLVELRELIGAGAREREELKDLRNWPTLLARLRAATPTGKTLAPWFKAVADNPSEQNIVANSGLSDRPFWKPKQLFDLAEALWQGRKVNSIALLAGQMAELCSAASAAEKLPGLARLMPGFDASVPKDLPFDRHTFNTEALAPRAAEQEAPAEDTPTGDQTQRRRRRRRAAEPAEQAPARQERRPREPRMLLARYHTRALLAETLQTYGTVRAALAQIGPREPAAREALTALDAAARTYVDHFFGDWYDVYGDYRKLLDEPTLALLSKCGAGTLDWAAFQQEVAQNGRKLVNEIARRFEALVREAVLYADAFEAGERGERALDLIDERLAYLRRSNRSLPDELDDIWKSADDTRQDDAERVLSGRFVSVWGEYLRGIERLGPQATQASAAPDLTKLRKELEASMRWQRMRPEDFHFIRPLIDLAEHGQRLLVHHLDSELARTFAQYNHKYPVVPARDARDDSYSLEQLKRLGAGALRPQDVLGLLRQTAQFRERYGELYKAVNPDSDAHRALRMCAEWVEFLYGPRAEELRRDRNPGPLEVSVSVRRARKSLDAYALYYRFTISLPLLGEDSLEPVGPIRFFPESVPAADGKGLIAKPGEQLKLRWSLFETGRRYGATLARASDKNPNARAEFPDEVSTAELPGHPWSLLLLLGARADNDLRDDNKWRIPVRIKTAADPRPIGYDVILRLARPFPGPIPPLNPPGELPRMESASRYLEPGRPGSGAETRR